MTFENSCGVIQRANDNMNVNDIAALVQVVPAKDSTIWDALCIAGYDNINNYIVNLIDGIVVTVEPHFLEVVSKKRVKIVVGIALHEHEPFAHARVDSCYAYFSDDNSIWISSDDYDNLFSN